MFSDFSLKPPTVKDLEVFFKEVEAFKLSQRDMSREMQRIYLLKSSPKSFVDQQAQTLEPRRPLKSVSSAEVLAERNNLQESTAKILIELGYHETAGRLMPPQNLANLYEKIYARIINSAKENGVAESDIILPAFYFTRKDPKTGYQVSQFVRPAIDPTPLASEGWKLTLKSFELSGYEFGNMLKEKNSSWPQACFFMTLATS